jgi:EAL domain-containing protein (putative c-di-GMP-specific phosphodiesterase class I)
VHEAADPAEARNLLGAYTYTLVLTELSFSKGKLEGVNLIEGLAAQPLRPTIVATSAYEIAYSLAISRGADAFLSKPTRTEDLLFVLRKALDNRIHSPAISPETEMASKIDALLAEGGSQVFVQPIYRLSAGPIDSEPPELIAVELFTHGPAGSAYERPDALFAYAREANRECALDRYCLLRMLEAAAQIPAPIRISVNVHASTLGASSDFAKFLMECLVRTKIDPKRLTVEVVEHAPAWNQVEFLQTLGKLRKLGVKIALDDVGLGRSNFQMMIDAHPDCFKLDRYFICGCASDPERRAVIASIMTLAAEFGSEVIAEGVSNEDELCALHFLGIRLVQGYVLCPPKPLARGWANLATYDPTPKLADPDVEKDALRPERKPPSNSEGALGNARDGVSAQQKN